MAQSMEPGINNIGPESIILVWSHFGHILRKPVNMVILHFSVLFTRFEAERGPKTGKLEVKVSTTRSDEDPPYPGSTLSLPILQFDLS